MQHYRPRTIGVADGAAPRGQYRLYILEGVQSLISSSHEFEAADDDRALEIAETRRQGRPAELWNRDRKLKSWKDDR